MTQANRQSANFQTSAFNSDTDLQSANSRRVYKEMKQQIAMDALLQKHDDAKMIANKKTENKLADLANTNSSSGGGGGGGGGGMAAGLAAAASAGVPLAGPLAGALELFDALQQGYGSLNKFTGYDKYREAEMARGGISSWFPQRRAWKDYTDIFPEMYLPESEDTMNAASIFETRMQRSDNLATVLEGCTRQAELALLSRTVVGEMRNPFK